MLRYEWIDGLLFRYSYAYCSLDCSLLQTQSRSRSPLTRGSKSLPGASSLLESSSFGPFRGFSSLDTVTWRSAIVVSRTITVRAAVIGFAHRNAVTIDASISSIAVPVAAALIETLTFPSAAVTILVTTTIVMRIAFHTFSVGTGTIVRAKFAPLTVIVATTLIGTLTCSHCGNHGSHKKHCHMAQVHCTTLLLSVIESETETM